LKIRGKVRPKINASGSILLRSIKRSFFRQKKVSKNYAFYLNTVALDKTAILSIYIECKKDVIKSEKGRD